MIYLSSPTSPSPSIRIPIQDIILLHALRLPQPCLIRPPRIKISPGTSPSAVPGRARKCPIRRSHRGSFIPWAVIPGPPWTPPTTRKPSTHGNDGPHRNIALLVPFAMYVAADSFACPTEPGHQLFDSFCPAFDFVVQSRDLGGCCLSASREVKMCFPDPLGR